MFNIEPNHFDGTPKTRKEKLGEFGTKVEDTIDSHPLPASIFMICATNAVAYAALAWKVRPPRV